MIICVILCCVIYTLKVQAGTIIPPNIMGQKRGGDTQRIREQNDVYGAETIQLNGRTPRAPSWPEANSNKEKMFLLPRILEEGDQINITGIITSNSEWVSLSLLTERAGPNGMEPDYNNVASQLHIQFSDNPENESIKLKTIYNGVTEEIDTGFKSSDMFSGLSTSKTSEVIIRLDMVKGSNDDYAVDYYIGPSYIDKISLKHNSNDIRYITMDGDVEKVKKLDFVFA